MEQTNPAPRPIQFTHTFPQQNFRLLELPPELLELLSSEDAPTLHLKSPAPSSTAKPPNSASRDFVNLCTPTQTYSMRQVHSSNSIFLIQPPPSSSRRDGNDGAITDAAQQHEEDNAAVVTAVGLCKSTLEVQPLKEADAALHRAYRHALHVYDVEDVEADVEMMDVDLDNSEERKKTGSQDRQEIFSGFFADVPFSIAECERAWVEVCAFVHEKKETAELVCWQPTAEVKLAAWKKMLEGAELEGIDLGKQFLTRDLWRAVDGGAAPFPKSLFDAIVRRLMEESSLAASEGIYGDVKWVNFDSAKVVSWIGQVYLEATAPNPASEISRAKYLNGWKNLLPERLRAETSLDKVKNYYQPVDASSICFGQSLADNNTKAWPKGR